MIKQQVVAHFWPDPVQDVIIFNFNKYGFLIYKELIYYEQDND